MSGFMVCERECDQCLFSEHRIVSPSRMRELLKTTQRKDTFFVCHKATMAARTVACRGWYERFDCNLSRIAGRLGLTRFVDPETGESNGTTETAEPSVPEVRS